MVLIPYYLLRWLFFANGPDTLLSVEMAVSANGLDTLFSVEMAVSANGPDTLLSVEMAVFSQWS